MGITAALLNLLVAGTGYMIQGKLAKGIGTFVACVLLGLTVVGIPIAILVLLVTSYDALRH